MTLSLKDMYLIKAGELFLKGKNHKFFEKTLIQEIKNKTNCKNLINLHNQYLIDEGENLNKVFGISNYSKVIECNFDKIKEEALKLVEENKSLSILCKRSTKNYKPSPEIERETAEFILKQKPLKINLTNPEQIIYITLINGKAYVYKNKIKGLGGLPIGSEAEVLIKVKNEKLSTVTGFLILKRGCKISLTKELPLLKPYYNYKIKENSDVIATDETIETLKFKTKNKLILRPLIGLSKEEINNIYSNL